MCACKTCSCGSGDPVGDSFWLGASETETRESEWSVVGLHVQTDKELKVLSEYGCAFETRFVLTFKELSGFERRQRSRRGARAPVSDLKTRTVTRSPGCSRDRIWLRSSFYFFTFQVVKFVRFAG